MAVRFEVQIQTKDASNLLSLAAAHGAIKNRALNFCARHDEKSLATPALGVENEVSDGRRSRTAPTRMGGESQGMTLDDRIYVLTPQARVIEHVQPAGDTG